MMDSERLRILKMLEEGKISADEAARLLDALQAQAASDEKGPSPTASSGPRWLRIRIADGDGSRVNVDVPVKLLNLPFKLLGSRLTGRAEQDEALWAALREAVAKGDVGKIVDIKDNDGSVVEIYLE